MFRKITFIVSFILISLYGMAQKNINNYKYIIVPHKFEFSKSDDQYRLNSLTKFLFNKYGFEAYFMEDDLPEDLKRDRCLALTSEVVKQKGGMFKTKLEMVLKDCFGTIVMTSQIGESREKEYDKAYNEAIREAFKTFHKLDYKYIPEKNVAVVAPKSEIKNIEEPKTVDVKKKDAKVIEAEIKTKVIEVEDKSIEKEEIYYAQAIENGYQLVNAEPKIVMILLNTAAENVFLVKDKNAIVYKEAGFWYYSENNGESVDQILMNIKF